MKYYLGLNSENNFNHPIFDNFDGIGMIRGENLCINKMQYFTIPGFCDYVTNYLIYVAKVFSDKPVWYRTADLTPHQIDALDGSDGSLSDDHYLIGERGIRRNLIFLNTYEKEIDAYLKSYSEQNNLGLLIPFISSVDEIVQVKKILERKYYHGKLGIMIEIPSMLFMLDEVNKLGIDYYTIGVNDLTCFLLGAKRDIPAYQKDNPAVVKAISYAVNKIHSFGKEVTLAGYLSKSVLEYAKELKLDGISIHYNEIPVLFDNLDSDFFTHHYDNIKSNYKRLRKIK